MPTWKFTKKIFAHPLPCILPSFSHDASWLILPKRRWKCVRTFSSRKYKQKVVLLVIYQFSHDSSVNFLHFEYGVWIWRFLGYSFCQINFISSFLAIPYKDYRNILPFALCSDMFFFYKNLIVLDHVDNNFIFWHLHQICTFNNNFNDEGMITFHLMCVISLC